MNISTIKRLKREIKILEDDFISKHAFLENSLKEEILKFQKICSHERTQIRDQFYYEDGHMSSKIQWKEAYCIDCGKVIAKTTNVETWVNIYEEDDEA